MKKISAARQAIFDKHGADEHYAKRLHEQLCKCYDKLIDLYSKHIKFGKNKEENGNKILEYFFAEEERQAAKLRARMDAKAKYEDQFQRTFGVPIFRYINPVLGFDVIAFDEQVVHAPDGESTRDAIKRQWGDEALEMVVALMA